MQEGIRPLKTWMYSKEFPEGVLFTCGSPEYIKCVRSGEWYNNPVKVGDPKAKPVTPDDAYGGPEQFQEFAEPVESFEDEAEGAQKRRPGRPKKAPSHNAHAVDGKLKIRQPKDPADPAQDEEK